jgi:hypothetical protein
MRRRLAAALAATTVVLAGCGGPRNALNTSESVCFRSIVVAKDAVHHKGRLVGVHKIAGASLPRHMPGITVATRDEVCLVAFRGDYREGDVEAANPPGAGRYAVVAVTTGAPTLLGARLSDDIPFRTHHPRPAV